VVCCRKALETDRHPVDPGANTRTIPLVIRKKNLLLSDQVIRENPASRGTEASAEVLVGPPLGAGGWSGTPVNSSGTR
jgi:hypothetical protein